MPLIVSSQTITRFNELTWSCLWVTDNGGFYGCFLVICDFRLTIKGCDVKVLYLGMVNTI